MSPAEAQQPKVYRVGVILHGGPYYDAINGLRDGLKELRLTEGKHYVLEIRDAKGDLKVVEEAARNLERGKVDLIFAVATSVTLAVKRATANLPIVSTPVATRWPLDLLRASRTLGAGSRACTTRQRISQPSVLKS